MDNDQSIAKFSQFMKGNPLSAFLLAILFASSLSAAGFATWYVFSVRAVHRLQPKVAEVNLVVSRAQMLVNEATEYRKQNPAIDPILQSLNPRSGVPVNQLAKPLSK